MTDDLDRFHPVIQAWFRDRVGVPTAVQCATWPAIAAGEHVLATAPTGSGKTLTAFLWAINQLLTERWPSGELALLYVSPLKALGADIQRNLLQPLDELRQRCGAAGLQVPDIRVQLRTGDTPPAERARMLRKPPEILITTPESLNLLLLSHPGRQVLASVRTVVLDEIHAVAATHRGTYLMTAVERLARIAGDPQRVALSATVRPLDVVAQFIGGQRKVVVVAPPSRKVLAVQIVNPLAGQTLDPGVPDSWWRGLVAWLKVRILANRSTLVFANNRRLVEKLARMINEAEPEPIAYAHHGSLAKELRQDVERRLKAGELKALCATGSLELGIDIGSVDEVVLLGAPRSLSAAIQRIGRAGHQVGAVSRGVLVPSHARDALACAVLAPLVVAGRSEAIQPVRAPLDVLAQVILAMCTTEPWLPDDLFAFMRTCAPYMTLSRTAFDLTLAMLRGRYVETSIAELTPRLRQDEATGHLQARAGAKLLLAQAGGVIPDRGYFHIRVAGSGARIGDLDEEFVWERHIGDEFSIGAQTWRIERITHDDVEVTPGHSRGAMAPFWRAEQEDRGWDLAGAEAAFLERIEPQLGDPGLTTDLAAATHMDAGAARQLQDLLGRQRQATGKLPHRHRIVVEVCPEPAQRASDGVDGRQVIVHAPWGGKALRPWAIVLDAAAIEQTGRSWRMQATDTCIGMSPPDGADVRDLLLSVTSDRVEALLRQRLGQTGYFGSRFREAAGRALLVPRQHMARRMPLWLTRQRAKRLLQSVAGYGDFPIVAETWRACLEDAFELDVLRERVDELLAGEIEIHIARTQKPSPLAEGLVWSSTNAAMYDDDSPQAAVPLAERVLQAVARQRDSRPRFAPHLVADLEARLQRTRLGDAPETAEDLVDLVLARVVMSEPEWDTLLAAMQRDHGIERSTLDAQLLGRVLHTQLPDATMQCTVTPFQHRRILAALEGPPLALGELLSEALRSLGPVTTTQLGALWGLQPCVLQPVLDGLCESGHVLVDRFILNDETLQVCWTDNVERLLRMQRVARRPGFAALPLSQLPLFLGHCQGLCKRATGPEGAQAALEKLMGLGAPAVTWEADILPARVAPYHTAWLDALLQTTDLIWYGTGPRELAFAPRHAVPLFAQTCGEAAAALLPDPHAGYDFGNLQTLARLPARDLAGQLWRLAFQGAVTCDGFAAVRQAALLDFDMPAQADKSAQRLSRGLQSGRLWPGAWRQLPATREPDVLEAAERDKERVRQLIDRYGVLFRELLAHEPPLLQWRRLLPAMRVMELSGELLAGQFFQDVPGLQFTTPTVMRRLQRGLDATPVFWMSAVDPASCCGIRLDGLRSQLPQRLPTTHLVFHGEHLMVVSRRGGDQLEVRVAPENPDLPRCLRALGELVARAFLPLRSLAVETVNGEPALRTPYRQALLDAGFEADLSRLVLRRSWLG